MENSIIKGEIKSLTGVRGIAALVIAVHHFISKYYIQGFEQRAGDSWLDYVLFNFANHGYLMVELFFILSGFVLALSYDSKFADGITKTTYKQFMIKRFNRIYPLYFFSTIVFFFVFNLDKINDLGILIVNFLFFEIWFPKTYSLNNVSWSLCTEWFLYLLFPFMLIKKDFFKNKIYLLFIISIVIFLLSPILNSQKLYDADVNFYVLELRVSNGTGALLRCLGSYIVGIAMYLIYKHKPKVLEFSGKYWSFILFLFFIFYGISKSDIVIDLLFGFLILSMTQINKLSSFFSSKGVYFLGLISYSIYLNHMIFLRFLNFSFKKHLWSETPNNIMVGFSIFLIATIIFSWFTYRFIELSFSKWLNLRNSK